MKVHFRGSEAFTSFFVIFLNMNICQLKAHCSAANWSLLISNHASYSGGSRISPRLGRQPYGGRQNTILPNFSKNCMKLKEFGPQGGLVPRSLLDPPLNYIKF